MHILRNHFWGSREPPPLCNIVIIWAYPPLCNTVIIFIVEAAAAESGAALEKAFKRKVQGAAQAC